MSNSLLLSSRQPSQRHIIDVTLTHYYSRQTLPEPTTICGLPTSSGLTSGKAHPLVLTSLTASVSLGGRLVWIVTLEECNDCVILILLATWPPRSKLCVGVGRKKPCLRWLGKFLTLGQWGSSTSRLYWP